MRLLCSDTLQLALAISLGISSVNSAGLEERAPKKVPKGFVTTRGTDFILDGKKFAFFGANSYWLPLLTTKEDVDRTLKGMRDHGVKVLRTWGFNAINQTELAGAQESSLTYYQLWQPDGTYKLNFGPEGLQRFDYVVKAAEKYDIKLIIPFTNNWIGYGGIDLYVRWMAPGGTQDLFFTDPKIIKAFQSYVKLFVNRYKDSKAIFAWELVNEARCRGELPSSAACSARTGTLTKWYKQQSDLIRQLDPYHLITTGGEGHFYWPKNTPGFWYNGVWVSDYNYNGDAGEDFDKDLALPNIDFGTYHMYPESWYPQLITPGSNFSIEAWGVQWIKQHAEAARKVGKPVILEEFSVGLYSNKKAWYPAWVQAALDTKQGGVMPWQYGQLGLTESGGNRLIKYADAIINGASPNDGNTYYKNQTEIWNLFEHVAKVQDSRSR
ncbi:hypothetical protein FRC03_003441 [Tulasnella sp. 419]|nr:hypothetical protein FRC03_003441 [Tulasnella sp. 419]